MPPLIQKLLGQGKSAYVYGLRSMFREDVLAFFYIDGHFTTTSAEKILSTLPWAKRNRAVVF